ncbi:hypothetical protein ACFLUA_01395 [Chloroflexota bacterium]
MKEIFNPCEYCVNVLTDECFDDCVHEERYKLFKLRPGTGIKELPDFPLEEILMVPSPRDRLVVVSIYLAAITDYLKHEDEYKFREEAPNKEKKIPDISKLRFKDGRNNDRTRSSRIPENVKIESLQNDPKRRDTEHEPR